ncbi:MAG TPA: hypothetical protein VD861_19510, partial [Pyrinomonadaceae bacterium]|nr:hypothetical protein [Pyrinomonadaceae bacterium]
MLKKISTPLFILLAFVFAAPLALARNAPAAQSGDGVALAPARFELEMAPGSETTVVVNLDYHTSRPDAQPYRLVASLNDWDINEKGEVGFY